MEYLPRLMEILLIVVIAVASTTLIYKLLPFRRWNKRKPVFTLFPKYVGRYACSTVEVKQALKRLKFERQSSGEYTRGKIYGDFSAKSIKLLVVVDSAKHEVRVGGAFFGILFDTGDLWTITSEIIGGVPQQSGR